jgi:cytochrome c-type biogenesis protein CcmH/NrfG
MLLPLSDAAKLAGISKSALFKAVKRGALSGVRDEVTGEWRIEISELQRVYTLKSAEPLTAEASEAPHSPARNRSDLSSAERQHYEARISALESERDYLRQSLQTESEERRQITRLLTQAQPSAELSEPSPRTPWILYVIALSTVTAAGVGVWHLVRSAN